MLDFRCSRQPSRHRNLEQLNITISDTNLAGVTSVGVVLFEHIITRVCEPISIIQLTKQAIKVEIGALAAVILGALDVAHANVCHIF